MEWWSAQHIDYRSPMVELANTINSLNGSTKGGIIVQALSASPFRKWVKYSEGGFG